MTAPPRDIRGRNDHHDPKRMLPCVAHAGQHARAVAHLGEEWACAGLGDAEEAAVRGEDTAAGCDAWMKRDTLERLREGSSTHGRAGWFDDMRTASRDGCAGPSCSPASSWRRPMRARPPSTASTRIMVSDSSAQRRSGPGGAQPQRLDAPARGYAQGPLSGGRQRAPRRRSGLERTDRIRPNALASRSGIQRFPFRDCRVAGRRCQS